MNLSSNYTINLRFKPFHTTLFLSRKSSIQFRQFRINRKRRRVKLAVVKNQLNNNNNPLETLFTDLLSQFPSTYSLDLLAPPLGLFSGLALYVSHWTSNKPSIISTVGNWILFTSPTPFNRFVLQRCPLVSFNENELLENVNENERVVKDKNHFLRLNTGSIQVTGGEEDAIECELEYQRVCISTQDGGVISLDWPANLDLQDEHGLDTTLLLVPGTAEGSREKKIRLFVCEALKNGFFPVVMNPRGCGGSPLTTARLFTAADSDDVCTAIQFITKARPQPTLMGVGWGYGANMLTKYLAEVGERTPLTAATCIDNPFDLEEATRSSPHHVHLDQKLTHGLIDVLRSNKELFQGRAKGFDVEKALLASSVREFEKAISMVSYGFDSIEDFYSKSSTQNVVGNVKIPVLFIQNDDGTVPPFSIPRSLIAENPFTSLLLCSCLPSSIVVSGKAAESWCQHLTIEWLTAVELGLLKGRHPLLNDVDVTIKPSNNIALLEGRPPGKDAKVNKPLDLIQTDTLNRLSSDPIREIFEDSNVAGRIRLRSKQNLQEMDDGGLLRTSSVDAELVKEKVKEEEANPEDSETGHVLQTAQVVMNMLDVTVPGTLSDEAKKKVLSAVGKGKTVMKALQDAVPEDVREKLTAAASGILNAEGSNLKLDGLLGIGKIPNISSELKSEIQEKVRGLTSAEGLYKDPPPADQVKKVDDLTDDSGGLESELHPSESSQKSTDVGQSQLMSSHQGDISISAGKGTNESENNHENDELIKEKAAPSSEFSEKGSERSTEPNFTSQSETAGGTEEEIVDENRVDQDSGASLQETKVENSNHNIEEKTLDSSADQNKMKPADGEEEPAMPQGSPSESQPMEREENDNQKTENKNLQPELDQNKSPTPDSNPPTFSVSQALDALTGMDDNTQVAVNSVFGVIENMITKLEEGKEGGNEDKNRNEVKDEKVVRVSEKQHIGSDHTLVKKEDNRNEVSVQCHETSTDSQHNAKTECLEEEPTQNPILFDGIGTTGSPANSTAKHLDIEKNKDLVGGKLLANYSDTLGYVNNTPLYKPINPYGDSPQNEYFRRYLSKMPNTKPLDLDTTTALFLDYFPEEGQWKLLEQPGNVGDSFGDLTTCKGVDREVQACSFVKVNGADKFIEPLYVIYDTDKQQEPIGEHEMMDGPNESGEDISKKLMHFVKTIILDSLEVQIDRKLSPSDRKEMEPDLARDLEKVATAVSWAVGQDEEHIWCFDGKEINLDCASGKVGTLHGENTIRAITSAVQSTSYLRRVLPMGVIVGSSLAALRKYFNVSPEHDNGQKGPMAFDLTKNSGGREHDKAIVTETNGMPVNKNTSLNGPANTEGFGDELKSLNHDTVMVGAVTAALGASAFLTKQQDSYEGEETENSSNAFNERGNNQSEPGKLEEAMSEKNQNNIVTSLAEKAMSVAGPVVPTKGDGEVDQERLVAMLADLGQRGGMLRLVGKIALLWGGLRGAMSLTDKLIMFLHIADRPLLQRILGFVGMVLVLWSPVLIPLLPSLVQSWATNSPSRIAELASIIGLYTAVMILVMIWGKRIRGYENPLAQYGLDMISLPKVQNFLKSLIAGVMLVLLIQSVNASIGCVSFSWPSSHRSSLGALAWLQGYVEMLALTFRGTITATAVVLVEELIFRSWLPEEISTDLGYHRGIIISGLAFSLFQRSPRAIPGLWLLSLALAGARQRSEGSLSAPIGLRTGIMASSYVLQTGGYLTYNPNFPSWIIGTQPFQPFSGIVGIAFALLLATIIYPKQDLQRTKLE